MLSAPDDQWFRVFVPFRFAAPFIEQCLESVNAQEYPHWKAYLFDDASSDGGAEIARRYADASARFEYRRSETSRGMLGNLLALLDLSEIDDEDVIVQMDGDDRFPDTRTLERVANAYRDPMVWITYGNFLRVGKRWANDTPTQVGSCRKVEQAADIRNLPWTSSALRTFKAHLVRRIKPEDLRDDEGNLFRAAGDVALMFPMIEMAGDRRNVCLPDINYVYNASSEHNDFRVRAAEQRRNHELLRTRPSYRCIG